jgi:hypothetical protein
MIGWSLLTNGEPDSKKDALAAMSRWKCALSKWISPFPVGFER